MYAAQQAAAEAQFSSFFCRALYDYETEDSASLSFRKNDVIEVLTRLESGWWDGLLGEERGWFPSNYVVIISEQEAEVELRRAEYTDARHTTGEDDGIVDIADGLTRGQGQSDHEENWLSDDIAYPGGSRNGLTDLANAAMENQTISSDFWVPQVTQDGQIYYVNTQTGQRSRELPREADVDISDSDAGMSQSSSRIGTRARLGNGGVAGRSGATSQNSNYAGFGLQKNSGVPEPWVKRLADDGMSYYYLNRIDGTVRWTPPEPEVIPYSDDEPLTRERKLTTSSSASSGYAKVNMREPTKQSERMRSDSGASEQQRERGYSNASRRLSVYSDDSDVQPSSYTSAGLPSSQGHNGRTSSAQKSTPIPHSLSQDEGEQQPELTSAELIAQSLQQALAPPPPSTVDDLSTVARQAIAGLRQTVDLNGVSYAPDQERDITDRVQSVVVAVRDLLYITVSISGPPPSNLIPRDAGRGDPNTGAASQMLQADLKPFQRKVTATLSKLVLSTRAAGLDRLLSAADTVTRIEQDAAELERAVVNFVHEVQRRHRQTVIQQLHARTGRKRLFGTFQTVNIGLGLVGAGAAGTWKGFGWVTLEAGVPDPSRALGTEAVTELRSYMVQVEDAIATLSSCLKQSTDDQGERVMSSGQDVVTRVSLFLSYVADINVARHVDVDEPSDSSATDEYIQTVRKARVLVRSLEVALQAVYDDAATLLLAAEASRLTEFPLEWTHRRSPFDMLGILHPSLKSNMVLVQQTMEGLMAVGREQSDTAQDRYDNSIGLRISRLGMVDGDFAAALSEISTGGGGLEDEDMVDMDYAFGGAPVPIRSQNSMDRSYDSNSGISTAQQSYNSSGRAQPPVPVDMSKRSGPIEDVTPWIQQDTSTSTLVSASGTTAGDASLEDDEPSPLFDEDNDGLTSSKPPKRSKLEKIFGDDAPRHYIETANADAKPWYLRPNYSNTEILINPDGGVRGGTLPALVERLTAHEIGDNTFIKTFLMTYKSFTDLDNLFDLLVQRYQIQPPEGLSPKELREWTSLKQNVIRLRVLNIFKQMVSDDDVLDKEDMYIIKRLKEFISTPEISSTPPAKQLATVLARAQAGNDLPKRLTANPGGASPPSIIPKSSKRLKLLDIDPLELARQLTILESRMYNKIRSIECLRRSREQKAPENGTDNIAHVIQMSNQIANWIADAVLTPEDSRRRAAVVKHFISVADRCRSLNNFSGMIAVTSGLNSPPIRRLKRTWEQVNAKFMAQLGICEMTIDSNKNFANYKASLAKVTPPCVPFIGLYLSVLTFIHFGSKDSLPGNLINFAKRQKVAEVIREIKHWQSKPYNLNPVAPVLAYIEESLNAFNEQPDLGDTFWNLSLEREPREREDEKMARLLQESGFL